MVQRSSLLVVENDLEVREALVRALSTENFHVLSASTSREAITTYSRNQVDGVLLDLNLQDGDGWNVFNKLKELRSDLPIFVISAEAARLEHSDCARAAGVLEKPFDLPVLIGLLKQTFEEQKTVIS